MVVAGKNTNPGITRLVRQQRRGSDAVAVYHGYDQGKAANVFAFVVVVGAVSKRGE